MDETGDGAKAGEGSACVTKDRVESLQVRSYAAHDRADVIALWREVFADDPPWNEPSQVIDAKTRVQPELFLVAQADGGLVGTVLAGFDGVRGWVHHLAVAPAVRRRGVGTALMRRAEEALLALGCPKLNLQVRERNEGVVAFYAALGFRRDAVVSLGKPLGRWHPGNGR